MVRFTRDHFDHTTNTLYIQHTEDVEPLLEENQRIKNSGTNGFSPSRLWRKIGSIPAIMIEKVLSEEGINMMDTRDPRSVKRLRQFLKDNNKFMTVDKI